MPAVGRLWPSCEKIFVLLASHGVLTVLLAGCQGGGEELDLEEVVLSDGAENVLDHPLGARAEQVAELGGVRLWSWRTLKMSDIFKQTN